MDPIKSGNNWYVYCGNNPLKVVDPNGLFRQPLPADAWLAYVEGLNVDRLVSLSALIAFAKVQQANRGYKKRYETDPNLKLDNSKNFSKLGVSPFRYIGSSGTNRVKSFPRNPFKNLR